MRSTALIEEHRGLSTVWVQGLLGNFKKEKAPSKRHLNVKILNVKNLNVKIKDY